MKAEDKELLIKDLSARLPYGVKVQIDLQSNIYPPMICKVCNIEFAEIGSSFIGVEVLPDSYSEYREFLCKPYLFPLSSMTEEQREEFLNIQKDERQILTDALIDYKYGKRDRIPTIASYKHIDWLNTYHFDYRGLIEKDLALDATGMNIY